MEPQSAASALGAGSDLECERARRSVGRIAGADAQITGAAIEGGASLGEEVAAALRALRRRDHHASSSFDRDVAATAILAAATTERHTASSTRGRRA